MDTFQELFSMDIYIVSPPVSCETDGVNPGM